MKKVVVLMSTYNGERYIESQINSVLMQSEVEIQLLIRDDNSTDATLSIIDRLASKDKRIKYYSGKNLGPAMSFLDLVVQAPNVDYYAFCDQDDVWDRDKIISAIRMLECFDQNEPNMYYSNLRVVDENLQFHHMANKKMNKEKYRFSCLTESISTGCTEVFNFAAKRIITSSSPDFCTMHDVWIYMICKIMGNVVYDHKSYISYRQHSSNAVGMKFDEDLKTKLSKKWKRFIDSGREPRFKNAVNFYKCYRNELSLNDRKEIEKMIKYKTSFIARLRLLFDFNIRATSLKRDIKYRIFIILQRI